MAASIHRIVTDEEITAVISDASVNQVKSTDCALVKSGYAKRTVVQTGIDWLQKVTKSAHERLVLVTHPDEDVPSIRPLSEDIKTASSQEFSLRGVLDYYEILDKLNKGVYVSGNNVIVSGIDAAVIKGRILANYYQELINAAENEVLKHLYSPLLGDLEFRTGAVNVGLSQNAITVPISRQTITFNGSFMTSYGTNVANALADLYFPMSSGATFMNSKTFRNFIGDASVRTLIANNLQLTSLNITGTSFGALSAIADPTFLNSTNVLRMHFGTIFVVDETDFGSSTTAQMLVPDNKIICIGGGAAAETAIECLIGETSMNGKGNYSMTPSGYSAKFYEDVEDKSKDSVHGYWQIRAKIGFVCPKPQRIVCITTV